MGERIDAGKRHPVDIRQEAAQAAVKLSILKQRGETVSQYLGQQDLFNDGTPAIEKTLLQLYDEFKRSPKKIAAVLQNFADIVDAMGDPRQVELGIRTETPGVGAVLALAIRKMEGTYGKANSDYQEVQIFEGGPGSGKENSRNLRQENGDAEQKSRPFGAPANTGTFGNEVKDVQGDFYDGKTLSLSDQRQAGENAQVSSISAAPSDGALFSALKVKFEKEKYLVFADNKINTPADVAFAFRELHNSYGERGFLIGVKNNKAVCVEALGIGDIAQSSVHPFKPLATLLNLKCDGFYLLHNHPGGTLIFSGADNKMTDVARAGYESIGVDYLGHILINGTHFAFNSPANETTIIKHHDSATSPRKVPVYEKYIEWTKDYSALPMVTSPQAAYEFIKGYQMADNQAGVLCQSTSNQVLGFHIVPMERLNIKEIARLAAGSRAPAVIIASKPMGRDAFILKALEVSKGLKSLNISLLDFISVDGDGAFVSAKQRDIIKEIQGRYGSDSVSSAQGVYFDGAAFDEFLDSPAIENAKARYVYDDARDKRTIADGVRYFVDTFSRYTATSPVIGKFGHRIVFHPDSRAVQRLGAMNAYYEYALHSITAARGSDFKVRYFDKSKVSNLGNILDIIKNADGYTENTKKNKIYYYRNIGGDKHAALVLEFTIEEGGRLVESDLRYVTHLPNTTRKRIASLGNPAPIDLGQDKTAGTTVIPGSKDIVAEGGKKVNTQDDTEIREDNSGYNLNDIPDGDVRPAAELKAEIKRVIKENDISIADFKKAIHDITGRSGSAMTDQELDSVLDALNGMVTDKRLANEMKNKTYRGTQQPMDLPGEPPRAAFVPVKDQGRQVDPEMRDALLDKEGKFFDLTVGQAGEACRPLAGAWIETTTLRVICSVNRGSILPVPVCGGRLVQDMNKNVGNEISTVMTVSDTAIKKLEPVMVQVPKEGKTAALPSGPERSGYIPSKEGPLPASGFSALQLQDDSIAPKSDNIKSGVNKIPAQEIGTTLFPACAGMIQERG